MGFVGDDPPVDRGQGTTESLGSGMTLVEDRAGP